jgi:hypothetical protein
MAIMRRRLGLETDLYQILQISSFRLLEKTPHFKRPSGHRPGRHFRRKRQPTDSLRLLTGQQWENLAALVRSTGVMRKMPSDDIREG